MKADKREAVDGREPVSLMEPMTIGQTSRHQGQLIDLAFKLGRMSAGFRAKLPSSVVASLAEFTWFS